MDGQSLLSKTAVRFGRTRRLALAGLVIPVIAAGAAPRLAAAGNRVTTTVTTSSAGTTTTPTATTPSPSAATASTSASALTSRTLDVPIYYQVYTLSCEEASLRMALASEGIDVTDAQVLEIIGTDPTSAYVDSTGLHWGDPYTSFVGSPSGSQVTRTGYGTYYPTIAKGATALGGTVLAAGEDIAPSTVYADVLAGHPVVAWVTYQWLSAQRSDYTAFDGKVIPYAGPVEHAVTVVGVTGTDVIINNPEFGREVISKGVFEASFATYNNMAVVLQ